MSQHLRTIKSFVIREGRLTLRQQQAMQAQWARYVLATETSMVWEEIFHRQAPITLEIGFGMGHALLKNAVTLPNHDFIGIEVYRPGIGTLLDRLATQQLENVRVFCGDAVEILARCIPDDSLSAIHIFFPDPWPKRRHHKRRLIQIPFVQGILRKLKSGGKLHLATDWEDYALHMKQVLSSFENLTEITNEADKKARPLTKYEQRGQKLGHAVWDGIFQLQ